MKKSEIDFKVNDKVHTFTIYHTDNVMIEVELSSWLRYTKDYRAISFCNHIMKIQSWSRALTQRQFNRLNRTK